MTPPGRQLTGRALSCSHLQVLFIRAPTIRISFTVQTRLGTGLALQSAVAGEGHPVTVARDRKGGGHLSFIHATTWEMSGRATSLIGISLGEAHLQFQQCAGLLSQGL